jgi:hypothetical protein
LSVIATSILVLTIVMAAANSNNDFSTNESGGDILGQKRFRRRPKASFGRPRASRTMNP